MKILILRFSSIGDIVLTSPVMRCIKKQLPNVELHFATKIQYRSILEANPYINKIITLENSLRGLINKIEYENYDFAIDLHHNFRTFIIKSNLQLKSKTFNKLNFQKWLMVRFKINRLPNKHIVDRYFQTVEHMGVSNDGEGLDYFIPARDEVNILSLPLKFQNKYVALVIGAMHYTKKLPNDRLIELCKKITDPVLLIGGKEDFENGETIKQYGGDLILNTCGEYNINQSASIIKQAYKVITHDTGMMHIAAAFKKDITSIWGNTIPGFGMYPYITNLHDQKEKNKILEVQNLYCRPCSKIGLEKCPEKHFKCMREINFNTIYP